MMEIFLTALMAIIAMLYYISFRNRKDLIIIHSKYILQYDGAILII
jgi:hypothetical protein